MLLALLAVPGAARADDRVIAAGVTAGGVDVGGLTVDAAAAKLDAVLSPHLRRDLVLGAGGVPYRLTMAQAKFAFDPLLTAQRAAHVPADATAPDAGGGEAAGVDVPLALTHSRVAVRAWVTSVARQAFHAPRDATLRITLRHLRLRRARVGRALYVAPAAAAVDAALDGDGSRILHQRLTEVRPRVNADTLRRTYSTVITVDREHFVLRLFKVLRLRKRYGIAVGMAGLDTPAGRYRIREKQVNPAWHVPHSAWAGSLQGRTIPGGAPDNPLKARWLGIANGVGIHGTAEDWSIGSRASHGCIRMHVADVVDLYPRVPVGTAVLIG
jgi:lipoprotein-anchoring transpeptidase ErfK/SrfK